MSEYFSSQPSPEEIDERMEGYPSWIEVDLDAIAYNLEAIRRRVGVEVIPCVKTNAYGHGLVPVTAHLMELGVKRFLVAKLLEARQLREAGLGCGIINMDPLFVERDYKAVVEMRITQTIYTRQAAESLSEAAGRLEETAKVFVKIDTGLGRVGVRCDEAPDLIEHLVGLPNLELEGVFSTFMEVPEVDKMQLERMLQVCGELERRGIAPETRTLASSYGILHHPDSYLDAVRPGITLFGVHPEHDSEALLELRPALAFKARVECVKWVEKGELLTYDGRFKAPRRTRVATLHVGYYDGYPRGLTNKGLDLVSKEYRRVLGTVSLNHHLIDVTGLDVKPGDMVELIGRGKNNARRVTELAGISSYQLLTGLNPLTPRVYYRGGRPIALSEPTLKESR
jgi:alanine racemase